MTTGFAPVEDALAAISAGGLVIVCDGADGEGHGDVVAAADAVTPEHVNFMATHARGLVSVALTGPAIERLALPAMAVRNPARNELSATVSIEARRGVSTGISAADRAHTIRVAADPASVPADVVRPGHVFPLPARGGGVLRRPGRAEAAVDLAELAGRQPAGALCRIIDDDGALARTPQLHVLGARHGLPVISIAQLVDHRQRREACVRRVAETSLATPHGSFRVLSYENGLDDAVDLALVMGAADAAQPMPTGVHAACLTGDALHVLRCDCGVRLRRGLALIARHGRGVLVVLQQEGRSGIAPRAAGAGTSAIAERILADLGARSTAPLDTQPHTGSAVRRILAGAGRG